MPRARHPTSINFGLSPQIDLDGAAGRGVIVYSLPDRWDGIIQEIENVQDLFAAVQMAVPLQEWRIAHGSYPSTLPFGQDSRDYNLSYRPSSNNHEYRILSRTGAVVLDMNDRPAHATQATKKVAFDLFAIIFILGPVVLKSSYWADQIKTASAETETSARFMLEWS